MIKKFLKKKSSAAGKMILHKLLQRTEFISQDPWQVGSQEATMPAHGV